MALGITVLRLIVAALLILFTSAFLRILYILPLTQARPTRSKSRHTPSHLLIVLGSGGHTAEMLSMLRSLDTTKYKPRTYVVSSGDDFSSSKAVDFENYLRAQQSSGAGQEEAGTKGPIDVEYEIITVPRARNIHQPLYTTPFSSFQCLIACIMLLIRTGRASSSLPVITTPDLIITNGPATGVIIILASLLVKFSGLQKGGDMRSIYVESWARVKTMSLSGKILYNFGLTNRFLVQWESLAASRAEYRGAVIE